MKKILCTIIGAIAVTIFAAMPANAHEIEGLHENLNALQLEKSDPELGKKMEENFLNYYNECWPGILEGLKHLGRMETDSDEEEYKYALEENKIDYRCGIKATVLNTYKYLYQYAQNSSLKYIFCDDIYWGILHVIRVPFTRSFTAGGEYISNLRETFEKEMYELCFNEEILNFLKDENKIAEMLSERGETTVTDMKVFAPYQMITILYIRCESNEYLVRLYSSPDGLDCLENIEKYKLYPAAEFIEKMAETKEEYGAPTGLIYYSQLIKPTYESEAESLQSEGMLKGNENGLDLLKPLSRIESAAMLLRAKGESENTDTAVQTFTDVPQSHWGYGAAQKAYSLGIVNGVGDDKFAPEKTVTAEEFCTMLLRSARESEFDWKQALNMLIERNIITEEESKTMDFFTRGDMAKILYEAKQNGLL